MRLAIARIVSVIVTILWVVGTALAQRSEAGFIACAVGPNNLPVRCYRYNGHTFAVAEVDLRTATLTVSARAGRTARYEDIHAELRAQGITPWLITNGGIYDTAWRPLGLLISNGRMMCRLNRAVSSRGNFSWQSAVFQTLADNTAEIVPAKEWVSREHIVSATQSGPMLVAAGKPNAQFSRQSRFKSTRTAIGIASSDRHIINIVVSQDEVTLFELAQFMKQVLRCSEALHLDGGLSALFLPDTRTYLFHDPGALVVTYLAAIKK